MSKPRNWTTVGRIFNVIGDRWQWLQEGHHTAVTDGDAIAEEDGSPNDVAAPRFLRVVVVGGSVTKGTNCVRAFSTITGAKIGDRVCAWPNQLNNLLNNLAGGKELIRVTNLGKFDHQGY